MEYTIYKNEAEFLEAKSEGKHVFIALTCVICGDEVLEEELKDSINFTCEGGRHPRYPSAHYKDGQKIQYNKAEPWALEPDRVQPVEIKLSQAIRDGAKMAPGQSYDSTHLYTNDFTLIGWHVLTAAWVGAGYTSDNVDLHVIEELFPALREDNRRLTNKIYRWSSVYHSSFEEIAQHLEDLGY